MKNRMIFLLLLLFSALSWVRGQDIAYNGDPDRSFFIARDLAFNGQRTVARDTLNKILAKYPDYSDVRNLLASTYSWDGNYEVARAHFNRITSIDRKNKEAWVAAIKNELYAKEYYLALGLEQQGFDIILPADPVPYLHYRRKAMTDHESAPKKKRKFRSTDW